MSGGCRIPLFAFSPSLHLERARIMGPSVGRLPPSKVREQGDRRGTGYDCCTTSSSISPAWWLGAHTRGPAAACPFPATPAEPGGKGVRSPGSSLLRAAQTRRGGGGCTDPRQRLCRALGAAGGGGKPAHSQPVASAVQPRGRRERGRQVCPARRHRAHRPPTPSPLQQLRLSAGGGPRPVRPPPPELRPAGAKPSFSPVPRRRTGGRRRRGCRPGGLAPSPGPHSLSGE